MVNITDIDGEVTKSALDALEVHIDNVFNKIGIDVGFTRHFLDRVNDTRNGKQITIRELGRLFAKEYKRWGKPIAQMGPDKEAVMKDLESDVNIPFVLKWNRKTNQLDLVAKTVMRKKNFKSPDREFPVESVDQVRGSEPLPKNSTPSRTGTQPHPYKGRLVGEAELTEDFGSIPPLTDLIVMAVVGRTTVAVLKAAFKAGKNLLKLKKLADRAGVKLANTVYKEEYNEAINRDELQAKFAARASENFYGSALQALDRLVKSKGTKQSVGGYAFDIARAFQGINARQLEKMYNERQSVKEERISQVNVPDTWNPGNIGNDLLGYRSSLIGTLGPIHLYQHGGGRNRYIFITTSKPSKDSNEPVIIEGEILIKQEYTEDSVTLWQVKGSALSKKLRGKKLMPKIYAYLIKKGFFLRSDTDQSKGGMKIWAELAKIPGITVYAAKEDAHGNMDYTAVDGDEVLAGDFPLYRNEGVDEYTDEIKAARSQLNVLLSQSEKVTDPKQLEKMQADMDFLEDHVRKLTKKRDEIYHDDLLSRQKNEDIYLLATSDTKPKNESINEVSSVDLPKSWGWIDNTDWEGKNTKYVKKLGRLGGYDIVLEQYGNNSRKVFLVTDKNENSALNRKPISMIEFERDYGNREGMEYWIAKATIIHPSWQGKGIAPKLYAFLCKKGWTIRSDDLQSQGGKKIWIALSKVPGITVYAAKNDNGNWELSDIDNDVDDFLRSGFNTYDTELKNEVKEIERELDFVQDKIREVWDDYNSIDKTDTANLARLKKEYADLRTMEKKLQDEQVDAQGKQFWNEEHEDVYLFAHASGGPTSGKPKTESLKNNEKMTENTGNIKINPVSVSDHYKGETFGTKYLMVDGVIKAGVDVSIVDDEVHISHVVTADDSRRKGYAKMAVDDLFKEFPNKKISVSNMTDDGSAFFRSQYSVDDETGEIQKKLGEEIETVKVSKDWKSYLWGALINRFYNNYKEDEPMGKFRVFINKNGREINALLCDEEAKMHALVHMSRSSSKSPCVIHAAALDPALQGKGLMPKFYAHLITKVGLFLQADSMQSAGGRKVWVALSKDPTVTVFTAYKENGVEKYSQVEGDNLLYSDAPIYNDERDENVAEIKNEINSVTNLINKYMDQRDTATDEATQQKLRSYIEELNAKREELRKEYLTALPKKPKKTFSKLLAVPAKTPTSESVNETIKKVKGGYQLRSKDSKKNLGTYPTKAGAQKRERQVQYFKHMNESYKLQLERDDNLYVLHILNTDSGKRTEVRGKANYETNGYDSNDKLHQLLDTIGKSANISELMNGEVVTINPKHPQGAIAKKETDVAFNEEQIDELKIVKPHPDDTLGVPRRHMPQIDEKHYEDLFRYIYENGGKIKKETVDPADLMSTQSEFSDKGVEAAMTNGKMDKPIIISSDDYVLDGHHRWLAAKNAKIHKITAFRMSLPAKEGLSMLINFPQTTFKDIHEAGGVGKIVKGVNTTIDVGPNEIVKQAAKFGNKVSKDGVPAKMLFSENMDHRTDIQAVSELKAALLANKNKLKGKDSDTVYKLIDRLMTRVAKAHGLTGQQIHDMWVDEYNEIPDTWIMNERLAESFNKVYPWKWSEKKDWGWAAKFKDITVTIATDPTESAWEVKFSRNYSMEITGGGDQFGIFATVLDIMRDFVQTMNPRVITFSAEKEDQRTKSNSRPKLYSAMVRKFANQNGYDSKEKSQYDDYVDYVLVKKKQDAHITENISGGSRMLTEAQLQEAMLDSVTKWLGSKAQNTIDDLSATILTMKDAAVLIKDILMDETYFEKSYIQMVKSSRGMLKQLSSVLNTAIGLVNNETVVATLKDMVQNVITFASSIFKRGGIIGFLGSLGVYAFAKYMVQNLNNAKTILSNIIQSNFADQFGTFISTVMNVATEKVPGLTFFSFFENLNAVKELFFEVLSSIKRKLEFGRNLNANAA
jgi:hypothetical protein